MSAPPPPVAAPAPSDTASPTHAARWPAPTWAAATVVLTGLYLLSMDATVLNVAVPDLQRDLGPSMAQVQWIIDGFPLVVAGAVMAGGVLSDRWGHRRSFISGVLVCCVASVFGATASDPGVVIAARAAMGAGAALVMPAGMSVLITSLYVTPERRRRAFTAWTMAVAVGGLSGPVVGGALVELFSWRAGFWANVPVAAGLAVAAWFLVPESGRTRKGRVDAVGCLLSSGALLCVLWGLIEAPVHGWTSGPVLTAYVVAVLLAVAFRAQQRRAAAPLLDRDLRGDRHVRCALASGVVMCMAAFGMLFLISLYLQSMLGYTPWQAGLRTLPMTVSMLPGALCALYLLQRSLVRAAMTGGLAVLTSGLLLLTTVSASSGYGLIAAVQSLCGLGAGLLATVVNEIVMAAAGERRAGVGSALHDASREVGSALGIAVLGSVLMTAFRDRLPAAPAGGGVLPAQDDPVTALDVLTRMGELPGPAQEAVREAFAHALSLAAAVAAGVTLTTAAAMWWGLRAVARTQPEPSATAQEPSGSAQLTGRPEAG
ncbi:MFS transporter [Streptomyces sp. NPDC056773]|uniref:MFS transporter n=1 Tax=unclassified Streptomyces TaxID=2593676 RepID=UPI0036C53523